ncbi:hypothetical protein BpHYR1_038531 [Brachionus plicatilis]|uniref:Uncharacterized protein n=1 Tax=Brachionus plicatilis TaxID=10195 RepID=A0A3M7QSH2_BRAPC|nr:hypothetical protein BpHYR1_038531 [Brachionus plicatilis]
MIFERYLKLGPLIQLNFLQTTWLFVWLGFVGRVVAGIYFELHGLVIGPVEFELFAVVLPQFLDELSAHKIAGVRGQMRIMI